MIWETWMIVFLNLKAQIHLRLAAPSKNTSMVPVGQKIYVPRQSIKLYKKWLKQNGEKSGVINYK